MSSNLQPWFHSRNSSVREPSSNRQRPRRQQRPLMRELADQHYSPQQIDHLQIHEERQKSLYQDPVDYIPPSMLYYPPPTVVRLPTGELVNTPLEWGPYYWYQPWEWYEKELNYMNLWYHALRSHFQQGKSSPLWKGIQGRLGYVNLMAPCSDMVTTIDNPQIFLAFDAPLCHGSRYLESLDLGCHHASLAVVNDYCTTTPNQPFGPVYQADAHYLALSTNYKSNFDLKQDGYPLKISLVPLSPASKYHVDTLLRYDEFRNTNRGYRGRGFKLNLQYVNKMKYSFTLFPKLPSEIQGHIIRNITESQPRRLLLRFSEHCSTSFTIFERRTVHPILQVNKALRAMGTPLHNFVELKHREEDPRGLIFLPDIDMIFISKELAVYLTPEVFKASLLASKCLHKLKCIAISVRHRQFRAFISDLRNYTALELVFVVVSESERDNMARRWGLKNRPGDLVDSRLSCKKEILFEVLHPSNPWADSEIIPGIKTKSGRPATYRDPEAMEQLVLEMSRGEGEERVAPNVRFVRLVKCLKIGEENTRRVRRLPF